MKIAVLSGKGGTGKTLVSVNLASVAKANQKRSQSKFPLWTKKYAMDAVNKEKEKEHE